MTEPPAAGPPLRRPRSKRVYWASVLLFAALFALLTYRMADEASPTRTARAVQVRKVVKRRVVTTVIPGPGQNSVSAGPATASGSVAAAPEPVVTGAS